MGGPRQPFRKNEHLASAFGGHRLPVVSLAEQPDEPRIKVLPPEEALRRATPLPPRDRLVIEGVPEDDWTAFQEALAEA